jgi:hypothetical protein
MVPLLDGRRVSDLGCFGLRIHRRADWYACRIRLHFMAISTLLLLSVVAQRALPQSGSDEALFEVPARFEMGCPIVAFDLASELKGRQKLEFLLDSGATRSMLLNSAEGKGRIFDPGKRGLLIPGASTVYAGFQDFAAPNLGQFNKDLFDRITNFHVQGVLAADFLVGHDVLVDYSAHRVYVSRTIDPQRQDSSSGRLILVGSRAGGPSQVLNRQYLVNSKPSANVGLSAEGRKLYVSATLNDGKSPSWRMRLDTWATRSTLPTKVAAGLRRTGRSEHVSAAAGSFDADQVEASISVADGVRLELKPVSTEATESVLGSDAFQGRTVLLQFGISRLRFWTESVLGAFARASG